MNKPVLVAVAGGERTGPAGRYAALPDVNHTTKIVIANADHAFSVPGTVANLVGRIGAAIPGIEGLIRRTSDVIAAIPEGLGPFSRRGRAPVLPLT